MPLHVSRTCAHHQEVKIALHSLWYHHTYRWPSGAQVEGAVHETATYRCEDTRGCVMQFLPPDDDHMCSKHLEAWNIFIVKQNFFASSWLITEINIQLHVSALYVSHHEDVQRTYSLRSMCGNFGRGARSRLTAPILRLVKAAKHLYSDAYFIMCMHRCSYYDPIVRLNIGNIY